MGKLFLCCLLLVILGAVNCELKVYEEFLHDDFKDFQQEYEAIPLNFEEVSHSKNFGDLFGDAKDDKRLNQQTNEKRFQPSLNENNGNKVNQKFKSSNVDNKANINQKLKSADNANRNQKFKSANLDNKVNINQKLKSADSARSSNNQKFKSSNSNIKNSHAEPQADSDKLHKKDLKSNRCVGRRCNK
eukprot:TRINITY_DN328_c0_g1_i1.p1 TRINITY_DN328_c0_g1~~TRINITY_DN328_c0_g1_i1.p1  ORF type:complete len:188 (+),score=67.62 TRINITY_DN328_c0_g1_i1:120-683(+)